MAIRIENGLPQRPDYRTDLRQPAAIEQLYAFTLDTDLTAAQQECTQTSYARNVREYSKKEWSKEALGGMWNSVFDHLRTLLTELPAGKKRIAVPGMGSGRDSYFLTELFGDLDVYGSDLMQEMVDMANDRLEWADIVQLANFIQERDPSREYWIHTVIRKLEELDLAIGQKDTDGKPVSVANSDPMQQRIIDLIQQRVHLSQQDMRQLNYPDNSFDVILNVGNFPHLLKTELLPTILSMVNKLKVGGTLSFDLKMDVILFDVPGRKGRVWLDTDIIGKRYFNTYTREEIRILSVQLREKGLVLQLEYQVAPHPNSKKPPFIRLSIVKRESFENGQKSS